MCKFLRDSVPKTMLADLKDAVKNGQSVNIQDKYGATPVCNVMYPFYCLCIHFVKLCVHLFVIYPFCSSIYPFLKITHTTVDLLYFIQCHY